MIMDIKELKWRQSLSLEDKLCLSRDRIKEWYNHFNGNVYVAFSGGKDSTVLLDIVRSVYPSVPAVFYNTGLEYPEIVEFVKDTKNVTTFRPRKTFAEIIKEHGYPIVSKSVANKISKLQRVGEKESKSKTLYLTGYNSKGEYCPNFKLSKKWRYLIEAPFKISDYCCDIMKKNIGKVIYKRAGLGAYIGSMACESRQRTLQYLNSGCNQFDIATPVSTPIAFWLERDIWEYLRRREIPYSKIYDMGEKRTGCIFCCFGVHLEAEPNRFQRMKVIHPKLYDYCIEKLGIGKVLDYIGVPYS